MYYEDSWRNCLFFMYVAFCTIYFLWNELPDTDMLQGLDNNGRREPTTCDAGLIIVLTIILFLLPDEIAPDDEGIEFGRKSVLSSKHKSISPIKDLGLKFSKAATASFESIRWQRRLTKV